MSESVAIHSYASAFFPQDKRSRCEWAGDNVRVPNMARGSRFDVDATPWQREPIDYSADVRVREMVLLWPTGAGKSNFVDVFASHSVAEVEGDLLLAVQGNAEAKKYVEKRLIPALRNIEKVRASMEAMGRFACKKGSIALPDKTVWWGGANETNAQALSVRAVIVDEAWMADHGLLEQFRARLHSRWNRIFCALGQGGMETIEIDRASVYTEWHAAWQRTDRREWCFQCPQCNEVQRYRLRDLKYDRGDDESELEETAIQQSARYQCVGVSREKQTCDAVFPDVVNTRRMLCNTGRYVVQHHKHRANHHGWHINALGIWYETWGDLALAHAKGHAARKRGDTEPLKLFRQKRMAENYRAEEELPATSMKLSPYSWKDYANGEEWEGESLRIMAIDVQRAHFWALVRAWKRDGSSRLLWFGKVNTWESLREIQEKYKVQSKWVLCDQQYDTDEVLNRCAQSNEYAPERIRDFPSPNHWARAGWTAMQGDKANRYKHTPARGPASYRFFSPYSFPRGSRGLPASHIFWSSLQVKRIMQKYRDGYRHSFEAPHDVGSLTDGPESESYLSQMFGDVEADSVSKLTGKVTRIFKKVRQHNHAGDLEAESIVGAMLAGILREEPPTNGAAEHSAPEPNSPPLVN